MLTLVLAESALETVPEKLWKHAAVQKYAQQRRRHPRYVILDRSYHHSAMKTLELSEKRGRPDIVHFALLEALGSPLSREKLLRVYVHTMNDYVVTVNPETRLPRNCNRFVSLMEQLFEFKRIPPDQTDTSLLTLRRENMTQLMRETKPSYTLALSTVGKPQTLEATVRKLVSQEKPAVFVGGFPHGHFSKTIAKLANEVVSIDREMLETWTVVSRVIYEFERCLSLPKRRLAVKELERDESLW